MVGGAVRDFLLNIKSKDFDIATSATPEDIQKIFENGIPIGKNFGVIKIPVKDENKNQSLVEIATFRKDLAYKDYRHPSKVEFSSPEEDAQRRDFTLNALFFDLKKNKILDCVNGSEDIEQKIIRAIGEPRVRFQEDALRLLRAIRFSTRFEFKIEKQTGEAIQKNSKLITKISAERIRDELTLMLKGPRSKDAFLKLMELGILRWILPEIENLPHIKKIELLEKLYPQRPGHLGWAVLLSPLEVEKVASIGRKFRLSREEISLISKMIEEQDKFKEVFKMREATLKRWLLQPGFGDILSLHQIEALSSDGNLAAYEFCLSQWEKIQGENVPPKLITGDDLIHLGLEPNPQFSKIIKFVEDLTLEGQIKTKEEALEVVVKHFVK